MDKEKFEKMFEMMKGCCAMMKKMMRSHTSSEHLFAQLQPIMD